MHMQNKKVLLTAALMLSVGCVIAARPEGQAPRGVRLEFLENIDLTDLSINYFLSGPFGGFGSYVHTKPAERSYDIQAWKTGQAAKTLKAIVYCPGQRFLLISESGFGDGAPKILPLRFEPLGSVPLTGTVIGWKHPKPVRIEVTYLAFWSHSYFGIVDGAVASFRVASAELSSEGRFAATIPDFGQDPVVTAVAEGERGLLQFVAREPESGNILFFLRQKDGQSSAGYVPIAEAYPSELQFDFDR